MYRSMNMKTRAKRLVALINKINVISFDCDYRDIQYLFKAERILLKRWSDKLPITQAGLKNISVRAV